MRIRTQLIIAAFLLAVVPLAAIVTWSYHSSRRALETAYRHEAERQTRQMDRRLGSIRSELDQRVRVAGALPLPRSGAPSEATDGLATVMGGASSLFEALDFQPAAAVPPASAERNDPETVAENEAQEDARERTSREPRPAPVTPAAAGPRAPRVPKMASVAPPAPPAPPTPVVIEIPDMSHLPRFSMTEEQEELIEEIGEVGSRLADLDLEPEEREDLNAEMRAMQEQLEKSLSANSKEFEEQMRAAVAAQRTEVRDHQPARAAQRLEAKRAVESQRADADRQHAAISSVAVPAPNPRAEINVRKATPKDIESAASHARKAALILGRNYKVPVSREGELVGELSARISANEVIRRVLGAADDGSNEIPFAIDREGTIYTRNDEERSRLTDLGVPSRVAAGGSVRDIPGWIVSISTDPQSGLRYGVARPVSDNFGELRRTAAQNFALGLGLIAFALIGIGPFSNHLSRDVKRVTDGAERIAQGDLMTRLPVKSKNEFGQLARAFNRMAEDLSHHQQKLVEQERSAKEQELQQRLLAVEYERKTNELEEARRFQLSMLPKVVPQHPLWDVAVYTRTATEVGGDYYDFHLVDDVLSVTIGDATGHGAKAGTMVTVVKTLFAGYDGHAAPATFLVEAEETIRRMELGRMAMALSLARLEGRRISLAAAGMPPALVHRAATATVEEIAIEATPLGTFGSAYPQRDVELEQGDCVLLMTDGFPELLDDSGQQLGYPRALDAFAAAAQEGDVSRVVSALAESVRHWHGDAPPNDDVTFVVIRAV